MLRGDFDIVGDDLGDSVVAELLVLLSPWLALACLVIWDARDPPREAVPVPEFEPSSLLKNLKMGSFRILAGRCWGGAVELDVIF